MDVKPLSEQCNDPSCWCHLSTNTGYITEAHKQRNARQQVENLAEQFLAVAEPISAWGGSFDYDGALNILWAAACKKRGLTPKHLEPQTVEEQPGGGELKAPHIARRRKITDTIRLRIYRRDGYTCNLCGSSDDLTLDHIVALANGGTNDEENLQTLCRSCNSRKGVKHWQSEEQK